jgi:hypothetical protein
LKFVDLEFETDVQTTAPEPALYETAYVTSHKGNCRAGAFSVDGQLIATGSVDASIKVRGHCKSMLFCYRFMAGETDGKVDRYIV